MNATCQRLLDLLNDGLADAICITAQELVLGVDLDPGQQLTWLASARIDGALVHIFFCEADGEDEQFILTQHGAGGLLIGFAGPCLSYGEAKRMAGHPLLGWTEG
jgi:hypothetical protein